MKKSYRLLLFVSCLLLLHFGQPLVKAETLLETETALPEIAELSERSARVITSIQNSPLYKPIYAGIKTPIASKFGFQPKATAQTKVSVYHNGREIPNDGKRATLNKDIIAEKKPYIIATNMGIMNGRSIDVRFTPIGITGGINYVETFYVGLDKNASVTKYALLAVSDTGSSAPQFKMEFLDSQTKQPVIMAGNVTIGDVDNGERLVIEPVGSRIDSIYAMSDSILRSDDASAPEKAVILAQTSGDVAETNRRAWVTVAYEKATSLLITYSAARTGLFLGNHEFEEFDYVEEGEVPPIGLATVDVYHKNTLGVEIAPKQQLRGEINTLYQTQSKSIPGYKVLPAPSNAVGLFTAQPISVTYTYEPIGGAVEESGTVRVFHKDLAGKELAPMEIITGKLNSIYQAQAKVIPGYKIAQEPANKVGLISSATPDVIFVYQQDKPNTSGYQPPVKQVDTDNILDDDKLLYTITQQVPASATNTELNNFAMKDTIPSILTVDSVNIYDQTGALVNHFFNISQNAQEVVALANPAYLVVGLLYNKTYRLEIQTHLTSGANLQPFMDQTGQQLLLPNKATTLLTKKNTGETIELTSNEVTGRIQLQTVKVKHVDTSGRELAPTETLAGVLGGAYESTAALIPGYTLTKPPSNASGIYSKAAPDVIYTYQQEAPTEPEVGNKAPVLKLGIKEGVSDGKAFDVAGIWQDVDSTAVLLMYKVDNNPLKLIRVVPNLNPGTWQPFTYKIPAEEIPIGEHTVEFYVHDVEGLSSPVDTLILKPVVGATLELKFQDEDGEEVASTLTLPVKLQDKIDLRQLAELQVTLTSLVNMGYELIPQKTDEIIVEANKTSLVFVVKGLVSLVDVTPEMTFKPGTVAPFDQSLQYEGTTPFSLNVKDLRAQITPAEGFKRGQFQISGTLVAPFKNVSGKELSKAKLIYFDGSVEREISTQGNEIYRSSSARAAKNYEIKLSNEANKELRLEVPKGSGVVQGAYQAEIIWELVQGP